MSGNNKRTIMLPKNSSVAHDNQKESMMTWCKKHLKALKEHKVFATGTTGKLIEQTCGLKVKKFVSGPLAEISK